MEYNTSHIGKSVNIGGDRVFRRKLCEFPVVLSSLISAIVGIPASDIREFRGVILYDQCSDDQDALRSNVFISFLLSTLSSFFPNTLLLKGGFLGFRAAYPGLCWEHSEKLPGEEYVHVLKDCCLGTTLDRCLSELPADAVASPHSAAPFTTSFCVTHVRIPSTPSSSNSEISSFSSSDSGVGSSSSTDISR
ncbi:Dual specificity protein phosphatase 16 [Sparganum proliferum]